MTVEFRQDPDPQLDNNLGTIGGGGSNEGSGGGGGGTPHGDDGDLLGRKANIQNAVEVVSRHD